MRKVIIIILSLLIILIYMSCATQTVTIMTKPEDAKIYVDGEYLGKGEGSFNAGLKYTIPQSHNVQITHNIYDDFQTVIKNKLDVKRAGMECGIIFGMGVILSLVHYATYDPTYSTDKTGLYLGYGYMLISPISFLYTYKFNDSYKYDLTE